MKAFEALSKRIQHVEEMLPNDETPKMLDSCASQGIAIEDSTQYESRTRRTRLKGAATN